MAVEILGRDAGNLYAAWKSVFVGIAIATTDESTVEALRSALEQHASRHPRFPVVFVVAESAAIPDGTARKLIAKLLTDVSPHVIAWALVQEGSGFRAAIVRSVVSGLLLLARHPYPFKSFATAIEAAAWLATHETDVSAPDLDATVAWLKDRWIAGKPKA
jgi:hypothetical protein